MGSDCCKSRNKEEKADIKQKKSPGDEQDQLYTQRSEYPNNNLQSEQDTPRLSKSQIKLAMYFQSQGKAQTPLIESNNAQINKQKVLAPPSPISQPVPSPLQNQNQKQEEQVHYVKDLEENQKLAQPVEQQFEKQAHPQIQVANQEFFTESAYEYVNELPIIAENDDHIEVVSQKHEIKEEEVEEKYQDFQANLPSEPKVIDAQQISNSGLERYIVIQGQQNENPVQDRYIVIQEPQIEDPAHFYDDGVNKYKWDVQNQKWNVIEAAPVDPHEQSKNNLLNLVLQDETIKAHINKSGEEISYAKNRDTTQNREGDPAEILPETPPDVRIYRKMKQFKLPGKLNPLFLLKLTEKITSSTVSYPKLDQKIIEQFDLMSDRPILNKKQRRQNKSIELDL